MSSVATFDLDREVAKSIFGGNDSLIEFLDKLSEILKRARQTMKESNDTVKANPDCDQTRLAVKTAIRNIRNEYDDMVRQYLEANQDAAL